MILTKKEVMKEINSDRIKISPFSQKNLGTTSYDLSLSNEFRFFKEDCNALLIDEKSDYKKVTKKVIAKKGIVIQPGQLVLGITKEKIRLPEDIAGWLEGRSRFARLGLAIHNTASFLQPGINNKQVLEIYNAGAAPLVLKPGTRICQVIFQRCEGKAKYAGKFKGQSL